MRKIKMEEIKEKGKAWVEKNQFWLGYAYAFGVMYVGSMIVAKVFEPKKYAWELTTNPEKDRFMMATYAIDRFGNDRGYGVVGNIDDFKDTVKSMIEHAQAEGIDLS